MIPFNKPHLTGLETKYIEEAVSIGKISGNGWFTGKCHSFFKEQLGSKKVLLTTSCTDALEMSAILLDVQEGDEIIMPSFTFVSTANAFVLRGAKIVFADSSKENPNIDVSSIEELITDKTKAIVVVHYAGVAVDMDKVMSLANQYNLYVVEDAAQAVDSFYKGRPLGTIGHLAAFSFHETKNIISGEGGLLVINDSKFIDRAEIIWEKGTNRSAFFRGEVNKYNWVDIGSSFLPSDITAAFLFAQIENWEDIQAKRKQLWNKYYIKLKPLSEKRNIQLPYIPSYATNNGHMFYLVCNSNDERSNLIEFLKKNNVVAVFHYLSLHNSPYYQEKYNGGILANTKEYTERLVRLPLFYDLSFKDQDYIIDLIYQFYEI